MKKIITLFLIIMSSNVLAFTSHSYISTSVNFNKFQQCRHYIQQCPMTGPVRENKCVQKIISSHRNNCQQLSTLSKKLFVDPSTLRAEKMGNLTLLTLFYPADGKTMYAVVTSNGKIISLTADPRIYDKYFAKQNMHESIFVTALAKPTYQKLNTGVQQINLNISMTKHCLACQSIGDALMIFDFDASGKFISAKIKQKNPKK